jgi:hypothetical protein
MYFIRIHKFTSTTIKFFRKCIKCKFSYYIRYLYCDFLFLICDVHKGAALVLFVQRCEEIPAKPWQLLLAERCRNFSLCANVTSEPIHAADTNQPCA